VRIPQCIIDFYTSDKIINIHPGLLPLYGGKGMYGDNVHKKVIENDEDESGVVIHKCNNEYDKGDKIFEFRCKVFPFDTSETLAEKIHLIEQDFFPVVIKNYIKNIFKLF